MRHAILTEVTVVSTSDAAKELDVEPMDFIGQLLTVCKEKGIQAFYPFQFSEADQDTLFDTYGDTSPLLIPYSDFLKVPGFDMSNVIRFPYNH